jgi:hypothetical protein
MILTVLFALLLGAIAWTFLEYVIHRWLVDPKTGSVRPEYAKDYELIRARSRP